MLVMTRLRTMTLMLIAWLPRGPVIANGFVRRRWRSLVSGRVIISRAPYLVKARGRKFALRLIRLACRGPRRRWLLVRLAVLLKKKRVLWKRLRLILVNPRLRVILLYR